MPTLPIWECVEVQLLILCGLCWFIPVVSMFALFVLVVWTVHSYRVDGRTWRTRERGTVRQV